VSPFNSLRAFFRISVWVRLAFVSVVFLPVLLLAAHVAAESSGPAPSLLEHARVIASPGVSRPERLSDRTIAQDGDYWHTQVTSAFSDAGGSVTWDLGQEAVIRSAYLQGDNNDAYILEVSSDNRTYQSLWVAPFVSSPGLRARFTHSISNAKGRYVKLTIHGGDHAYAVSEVRLSSDAQADLGSRLTEKKGIPVEDELHDRLVWFGIACAFSILFVRRKQNLWVTLGLLVPAVAATVWSASLVLELWPLGQREISLMRAIVAAIACFAILREALAAKRFAANPKVILGALGLSAIVATLTFVNLLNPQFWDHQQNKKSVVHNFDMRVYYPVAKYFRELHFDGLYLASVAAYVDDVPGTTLQSLDANEIRDLNTHYMVRVADVHDKVNAIRHRFTPERWNSFVKDMRYFRQTMGPGDYMASMHDHGGNATPFWFLIARILFYFTHAGNAVLIAGALLDPLLLGLMFYAVKRTFGWRTMLVGIVLFGANDFHMFGSNWVGATLRHDWMAYIGLGVCALATKRWWQAGTLLAMASLIRAFPAFILVSFTFPAIAWAYEFYQEQKRLPRWSEILRDQEPVVKVAKAASITVAAAVVLSSIVLGVSSWPQWWHKVNLLERDAHTNHESLRMFLSFDLTTVPTALFGDEPQMDWGRGLIHNWQSHQPLFAVLLAAAVIAVFSASSRRKLHQAAILGFILVPVVLSPANYYCHAFFLMSLVVLERERSSSGKLRIRPVTKRDAWIWAILLGLCVAQYRTVLVNDVGLHFLMSGTFMLTAFALILVLLLQRRRRAVDIEESEPEPQPEV